MANTPVNGIGWYLDSKGTLISPWIDSGAEPGSGIGTNNPNGNVSGFWGTFHEPNANSFGQYINSISQQPVGKVGSFSLGQRPDAYLGLAQSPIIQQQLANIDTKSKLGYGGSLGRWQFGSTGNAPQTAPVGWGRNPGTPGAGQVAPWQATQYRSNWYGPGSGNGQNMGGGNGGNTGGGGGNNGGTGGTGNDGNQTVLPAGYGITAASGIGQGTTGHTTAYTGLLGGTPAPGRAHVPCKQNALATNPGPRPTEPDHAGGNPRRPPRGQGEHGPDHVGCEQGEGRRQLHQLVRRLGALQGPVRAQETERREQLER